MIRKHKIRFSPGDRTCWGGFTTLPQAS